MIVSASVAAAVVVGVVVAAGVVAGAVAYSASASADATKYAADQAAAAQKYGSEQQRMASDHEADLLFKTEEADRALDEKRSKEDATEEKEMMAAFGMIDDIEVEESYRVDRRGRQQSVESGYSDEYEYPDPIGVSDDDMSFS